MITQNYLLKPVEEMTSEDMDEMSRYLQASMDDEEPEEREPYDPEQTMSLEVFFKIANSLAPRYRGYR